jgi:D-serine deaminase-like pyridoxal phosphate-dependent protein
VNYEHFREIFYDHRFPLAFLYLEAFRHNLALLREDFQRSGKAMRLCTKSVRCGPIIEEVLNESFVNGVMIYVFYLFAAINIVNLPLIAATLRLKREQPRQ